METKGFKLKQELITIVNELEKSTGLKVNIKDLGRTPKQHVDIYKKIYGAKWEANIAWDSRHLPCFETSDLRAIDLGLGKFTGLQLSVKIKEIATRLKIVVGIGVGSNFCHLDIRPVFAEWKYNY